MHPGEGLLPLQVHALPEEEKQWQKDRAGNFDNFREDNDVSKRKMAKVFNAASSALASLDSTMNDRRTHWVSAAVLARPHSTCPMLLNFTLRDMPCEAGWSSQCPLVLWISGASRLCYAKVRAVEVHPQAEALNISIEALTWLHDTVSDGVEEQGRYSSGQNDMIRAILTNVAA
ncbi:hypothetical protein Y032_1108g3617 [Ancylostoma ceylanicum]|uniref:Uncharacterized protein n=1 Tax=Ancylostoma ceylanicum TaxID=53326 RepID=A0A016W6K5_9BILA|nr:hypothetical protein Y032_1108g3617 [Ancylostoma ceylanicum]